MKDAKKQSLGLNGLDELFMNDQERAENKLPRIYDVPLREIDDFPDHPFKVKLDEDMDQLVESIKERGVIVPITLRQKEDGRYEIVSGHRRRKACELAGLETVRAEIKDLTRDEAIVLMVDSNLQRSHILPSEKAFSYKMRLEAMNRQGQRTDLTCDPVGHKLAGVKSVAYIADNSPDSKTQVQRYIRLTELIPALLDIVDEGRIGMRPAVELSYLSDEVQRDIVDIIDEHNGEVFPSHAQARRIRDQFKNGGITYEQIAAIMNEQKPNQVEKVKIPADELRKIVGKDMTDDAFIKYLFAAVEHYKNYLNKQQEKKRDNGAR